MEAPEDVASAAEALPMGAAALDDDTQVLGHVSVEAAGMDRTESARREFPVPPR